MMYFAFSGVQRCDGKDDDAVSLLIISSLVRAIPLPGKALCSHNILCLFRSQNYGGA